MPKIPDTLSSSESVGITFVVIKESVKSFLRHNNFEMSVALASYGFISIIPLLFFVAYLLSSLTAISNLMANGVDNLMAHIFPNLNIFNVRGLNFPASYRIAWGLISLSMILVSMMSVCDSLRTTFQKIFNASNEISFIRLQLANLLSTVIILALFVALLVAEAAYSSFAVLEVQNVLLIRYGDLLFSFIVANICMITVYIVFSPVRLKISHIISVSVVTSILLVVMKNLFSHFLSFNPDYGVAFGSMKTFIITIIWIYYCFLVILFGAEIIANARKREVLLLKNLFLGADEAEKVPEKFISRYIKNYNCGDVVFNEHENGDAMYFVLSGSVEISKKNKTIRAMNKGDYFGEMSTLLDAPRTATARISENNTQLVAISKDNFEIILKESPDIMLAILKEMAMRLKSTSESI